MNLHPRLARAVLAPLIAGTLVAGCGSSGDVADEPGASGTPSPAASPSPPTPSTTGAPGTPSPTPEPVPTDPVVTLTGISRGAAPGVPYAVDLDAPFLDGHYRVVEPGGARGGFPLPRGSIGEFVVQGDRVVQLRQTEGGVVAEVSDRAGAIVSEETFLTSHTLLVSDDRSIAGWLRDDGTVHTLDHGATHAVDLPKVRPGGEAAVLRGSTTCQEQSPGGGGCTAYVDVPGGHVRYTSSHGIVDRVPALITLSDLDARGRLAGRVERGRAGCWAVLTPRGREAWRTCDHRLDRFSPDGRHLLGLEGNARYGEIQGLVVHDRSGGVVARFTGPPRVADSVTQVVWEDDSHLLAVVRERDRTGIVRLGLDGSMELATRVGTAPSDASGYALERR